MLLLLKKSIANSFTILNLLLGFSAIVLIALSFSDSINNIKIACLLIFTATLIDVFDGKIARKLGTSGNFGKQIDSLADLVSFCLVPAFLIFFHYYDPYNSEDMNLKLGYLIFISSFPLIFGAIRLAMFNAYEEHSNQAYYFGLPTPGNALFICSMMYLMYEIDMNSFNSSLSSNVNFFSFINYPIKQLLFYDYYIFLILCSLSSILLISKVHYFKFPVFKSKIGRDNFVSLIGIVIFFVILLIGLINKEHNNVILFFITYYIVIGLFRWFWKLFKISGR